MYEALFAKQNRLIVRRKVAMMECPFLEPVTSGEAKSTGTIAMGSWADGRNFEKTTSETPFRK